LIGDSLNRGHANLGSGMSVLMQDICRLMRLWDKYIGDKKEITISSRDAVDAMIQRFYRDRYLNSSAVNMFADIMLDVYRHEDLPASLFSFMKESAVGDGLEAAAPLGSSPVWIHLNQGTWILSPRLDSTRSSVGGK